jgi:hypothetical protein
MKRSSSKTRIICALALALAVPALCPPVLAQEELGPDQVDLRAAAEELSAAQADTGATTTPDINPVVELLPAEPDYWTTGASSTAAVLMTPLLPGWGQLYTENSWRGALAFGLEMYYWSNLLLRDRRAVRAKDFRSTLAVDDPNRAAYDGIAQENWEQMRDFAWWSGGVLLIIALDSYVGAHLFNFERDAVPVPNDWEGQFGGPGDGLPLSSKGPTIVVFQHGWKF